MPCSVLDSVSLLAPGIGLLPSSVPVLILQQFLFDYNGLFGLSAQRSVAWACMFDLNYTFRIRAITFSGPANNSLEPAFSPGLICDITDSMRGRGNSYFEHHALDHRQTHL